MKHSIWRKESAAYVIGIVLFGVVMWKILGDRTHVELIRHISFSDLTISFLIAMCLFFNNGAIIAFLTAQQYHTTIKIIDMVLLPFMMHLWSFIIPFRGGLLFSAFFLKTKYRMKGSQSIAIGMYTIYINLILTGCCGIYFVIKNDLLFSLWTVCSLLCLFSPVVIWIIKHILDGLEFQNPSILNNLKNIIASVNESSRKLLLNVRVGVIVFALTFFNLILYIFFLYWITSILHFASSLDKIVMFALMMRLSTFVRVVPGNMGIQEVFSGGAYYLVGGSINDGLMIALFIRFLSLVLTFSLGTVGTMISMRHFNMRGAKEMWQALTRVHP